jgi:hypothetical protein
MSWKNIFKFDISLKDVIYLILLFWVIVKQYQIRRKQKREFDKRIIALKEKFGDILRDLNFLFESNIVYSFFNVLQKAKMDYDVFLSKVNLLNTWFYHFYQRFRTSNDLKMLFFELTTILILQQELFEKFTNRKETKDLYNSNPEFKDLYTQLKQKYNSIVSDRLQSYLKKSSQELNLGSEPYFKPLPDL